MLSKSKLLLYVTFFLALLSSLSSLYFTEFLNVSTCTLCWYQRIAMFPIVIISAVGILKKEQNLHLYILPFSLSGVAISFYQNLIYYGALPGSSTLCVNGFACAVPTLTWFGFFSIPFLTLLAFAFISLTMLIYILNKRRV